jgi:hypothetical protein
LEIWVSENEMRERERENKEYNITMIEDLMIIRPSKR